MSEAIVYLAGNPNSGKTTVFNVLTGLHQKTGNFPGVTVERKMGQLKFPTGQSIKLIDLPGAYSFYPTSLDERVVVQNFVTFPKRETKKISLNSPLEPTHKNVLYVADMMHIEKHLLLLQQILDTDAKVILVLNMYDQAQRHGIDVDVAVLQKKLNIPVIKISARDKTGIDELKEQLSQMLISPRTSNPSSYSIPRETKKVIGQLKSLFPLANDYQLNLLLHHYKWLPTLSEEEKSAIAQAATGYDSLKEQIDETMMRYDFLLPTIKKSVQKRQGADILFSDKIDAILTHKRVGPIIFFAIIFFVFQAIYTWSGYPMDLIDGWFASLNTYVKSIVPDGWIQSLLTDGIIAGLGGIIIFIPQIAILFFLIGILEEVGYMARAVYLFDRIMQRFGLSGRSIVALISSGACAIPAIMTTRTISNWNERLITILTAPFISCSARLPVYVLLVGIAVPDKSFLGFNLQGWAFTGLYLLGIVAALGSSFILKYFIKTDQRSFLAMEMPSYRLPVWRNILLNIWEKTGAFVIGAGKIIMVISVIIWAMSSYGPSNSMAVAEESAQEMAVDKKLAAPETANLIASYRLESSYAGRVGKFIEPAIKPLGYDWKIGIALLTSFAAREVFVGTMSTIYSLGEDADETTLRHKIANYRNAEGNLVFTTATSFSLLVFYVFAMQCMSTLAVVKRETNSWKWPILQFVFMTALAYFSALLVYQVMT